MRFVPEFFKRTIRSQLIRRGWTAPGSVDQAWSMRRGLQLLQSLGIQPGTIIDLGAAEGRWTQLAREVFTNSQFLLCEPLPQRKAVLEELASKSNSKLHFSPIVIGESTAPVWFDVSSDLDGSGVYGGKSGNAVLLPQNTLDNVLLEKSFDRPFLIKFDTHGFETQILSGASHTLEATDAIVMECYLHRVSPTAQLFWEMCVFLEGLGFRPVHISDLIARPYDQSLWQMDIFFVRSDHAVFHHDGYR
jgi:FkbM family methyltransferase